MTFDPATAPAYTTNHLDRRAARGTPLLACYFPMGDTLFDDGMRDLYVKAGVDILELGMPTTDPYLDGPDIAAAMARSLAGPIDPFDRLADVSGWLSADADRPAGVCMAYADLAVERIGARTLEALDGILVVGDADGTIATAMASHGVLDCGLVPLDFTPQQAADASTMGGYVMMQASPGTTGPRPALDSRLGDGIAALRAAGVTRPILAGFGIGTPAQAREAVDGGADGVVIGSMCMRQALLGPAAIRDFLSDVRAALDA